ncbi:MAG TPA: LEA type 2 family protein [Nitrososphaerales archaeon]|nr:LEA type 2 family protein [Nitrososphaerales archaeon]
MSNNRERRAFSLFLVIILVVMPAYLYYGYITRPSSAPWSVVGDIQLRATSVQVTGFALGGPDLSLTAVVYNPNGFGVSLNGASYSMYADGHYLKSGLITGEYPLAPLSTKAFVFPISIGWKPAFQTLGSYMWGWGNVRWEVKGTASIEVGGFSFSVPFDLTTGGS